MDQSDTAAPESPPPSVQVPPRVEPAAPIGELLQRVLALINGGDFATAQLLNEQAWQMAREAGLADAQVRAAIFASRLALRACRYGDAARLAAQAQNLAEPQADPILLAHARAAVARVSWMTGQNERALAELEAIWSVSESGGDADLKFTCENTFGIVVGNLGQFERSMQWHERAQRTAREAGLAAPEALAASNRVGRMLDLGDRALAAGDSATARAHWLALVLASAPVQELVQRAGSVDARLILECNRSAALAQLGRFEEALAAFDAVYRLGAQIGDATAVTHAMHYHVLMLQAQGNLAGARTLAQRAIESGLACQANTALAALYELASSIDEALSQAAGTPEQALHFMGEALLSYKRFHAVRSKNALEQAQLQAEVLAVRLETERALSDSKAARAQTLVLEQANEALSRDALQDALTGLANRRRLESHLHAAYADAQAGRTPLCVAMLDLDHFKRVNDGYSHAVGDRVLQQLGTILREHFRTADLPARLGGEEFVVVIDRVDLQQAAAICERLRIAVQGFDWPAIAPGLSVTTSIGLADIAAAPSVAAGLELVDSLLYQAKQNGRNQLARQVPAAASPGG